MDIDTILGIAFGFVCGLPLLAGLAAVVLGTIFKTRSGSTLRRW